MNMGMGIACDLGWKLAAAMRYGGRGLLKSFTADRRPVVLRNVKHSGVHMRVHSAVAQFFEGGDPHRADCPQRRAKRYEWPGSRGRHVFLSDGAAIFHHFGIVKCGQSSDVAQRRSFAFGSSQEHQSPG